MTTVLCTVNCKLRLMRVDSTEDDLVETRERVGLQNKFPEPVGRQTKTCLSQSSGGLLSFLTTAKPRRCLFHCLPSYWLKETHLTLGLSSRHNELLAIMMSQNYVFIKQ